MHNLLEMEKQHEAYHKSIELLREATTPWGILASITNETNYRRIWARDSVICGLAGLVAADPKITEGLRQSLIALASAQGKHGEIPSNVQLSNSGEQESLSFGGLCGRVDTVGWWIIGLTQYCLLTEDKTLAKNYLATVEQGLNLLEIWEFNGRGLVYVPQSGDWADEYILRGYILYDQLLRIWALESAANVFERTEWSEQAQCLRQLVEKNYWLNQNPKEDLYHEHAYQLSRQQKGDSKYWEASFSPGGYIRKFDLLANSLVLLLGIGTEEQKASLLSYTQKVAAERPLGLLPSFWEPINQEDQEWYLLEANHKYDFRNWPYEFHNGGLWPAFNGFWGMALVAAQSTDQAKNCLESIRQGIALEDWGFYECLHGQSGATSGTKFCSWSAAGLVLLQNALDGKKLIF